MAKRAKLCMVVVVVLVAMVGWSGCAQQLDEKVNASRETKYVADQAFVKLCQDTIKFAEEGWKKKHELQEQVIRQNWADWLKANGATVDAEGNWAGTIDVALTLKSLEVRHKADLDLEESKASVTKVVADLNHAIEAYVAANTDQYKTEQDAVEAKRNAVVAIQAALEAIGTLGGGFAAGLLAG